MKDLKVLSPCVDARNGRRFAIGETFDPVPTEDQAKRLFTAGCLPEGSIALGKKADEETEKTAATLTKAQAEETEKNSLIAAATDELALAKAVLVEADAALTAATSDDDKAKAGKRVTEAKADLKKAEDALAKLTN